LRKKEKIFNLLLTLDLQIIGIKSLELINGFGHSQYFVEVENHLEMEYIGENLKKVMMVFHHKRKEQDNLLLVIHLKNIQRIVV
jgi:hypothetical protein